MSTKREKTSCSSQSNAYSAHLGMGWVGKKRNIDNKLGNIVGVVSMISHKKSERHKKRSLRPENPTPAIKTS